MELKKWRPEQDTKSLMSDLFNIRNRMNNLFDLSLSNFFEDTPLAEGRFAPDVDIIEKDDRIEIRADLPGIEPKDVSIDLRNNVLTLSGTRKEEKESKDAHVYRSERYYGSFQRSFTLPDGINQDKVAAHYKNGVLNITVPKLEKAQPKQITIKVEDK
ncbi:MAG: Hsp20/alpha crystallin family protein [Candidatus Auribacterota bacterium]|jgi:HSP20 family protein|uniref:Hsp20/alpha crystallin family protein n=1 Tax=Candidatus Auribacter fodinae TaxID=2093366 RepID=A0A3A4RF77_9BACT|nr:MAG: Hsp20/alpha crystallin family protein [Candidatus Auribacter fodinae]